MLGRTEIINQLVELESQYNEYKKDGELHGFIDDFGPELKYALSQAIQVLSKERMKENAA